MEKGKRRQIICFYYLVNQAGYDDDDNDDCKLVQHTVFTQKTCSHRDAAKRIKPKGETGGEKSYQSDDAEK